MPTILVESLLIMGRVELERLHFEFCPSEPDPSVLSDLEIAESLENCFSPLLLQSIESFFIRHFGLSPRAIINQEMAKMAPNECLPGRLPRAPCIIKHQAHNSLTVIDGKA